MTRCISVGRTGCGWVVAALVGVCSGGLVAGDDAVRRPDEAVDSPEVRARSGLRPNENLLFNGWGVTPAGEQVPVADMPLKLVVAPDQKRLVAVHGGYNRHGITLIDVATRKETQFLPLTKS